MAGTTHFKSSVDTLGSFSVAGVAISASPAELN